MQNKPHLIFIATRVPYPLVTGHSIRTFNILRGLAEHFSIHFFGFRDKNETPAYYAPADRALMGICSSLHIEVVGAERNKGRFLIDLVSSLLKCQPFTAAKYHSRSMHKAIRAALRTHDVTVAHADSLQSGQYLTDVCIPKLLTNHNVEFLRLYRYAAQRRSVTHRLAFTIQGWLTKRYERTIVRDIGNCVVVSEQDLNILADVVPTARFFLVPNGADTSLPPLPPTDSTVFTALWVGGMNDPFNREGVLYFATRVLPRIQERIPEFEWYVVGRDPPPLLLSLASKRSAKLVIAGHLSSLREAYERSAIVVVPLLSGGGTKLKVLEAMAMGRAVVTTPVGAEGIGARDGTELEIASTDEDFARKTCELLLDPQRRNRIAAAARTLAERDFSWDAINQRMHFAVRCVISSCTRSRSRAACVE